MSDEVKEDAQKPNEASEEVKVEENKTEEKSMADTLYPEKEEKDEEKKEEVEKKEEEKRSKDDKEKEEKSEDKEKTEKKEEEKKEVPDKYEFKIPETSLVSDKDIERIESYAKEQGLSKEEGQKFFDSHNEATNEALDFYDKTKQEEAKNLINTVWPQAAKEDKEIGGEKFNETCEISKRLIEKVNVPGFSEELDNSGLGNHPLFLKYQRRLGEMMSDDKFIFSGSQSKEQPKSMEEILYPNDVKEKKEDSN